MSEQTISASSFVLKDIFISHASAKEAARQIIMKRTGSESRFSATVLAGGRSSRMGTDKAFLRIGDHLLVEHQLHRLRESGAAELLISGRPEVDYSRFAVRVVHDDYLHVGPLAGVAAALKASSCKLVLVLAVDMPRMIPEMIGKIISRCSKDIGCLPFDCHGLQPLGAAYPISLLPHAEHLLRIGRYSMREFASKAITEGLIQPLELEPAEQIYFTNMNLPQEWAAISK